MTAEPICGICLEMMKQGAIYRTQCMHEFCNSCMDQGYEKLRETRAGLEGYELFGIKCPLCRKFITMEVHKPPPPPPPPPRKTWWGKVKASFCRVAPHCVVGLFSGGATIAIIGMASVILFAAWPPTWVAVTVGAAGIGAYAFFVHTTKDKSRN